ncbi:MAG: sigma-E processing peptidase SpoIIGA [Firmicutes bacterium]|nr:sigma-E processing peptidase SpoIIGA [Bacillota bacterium]
MYIYADVVLAVNVVMNSIILLFTGWAAGCHYKVWRILLAAFLGGGYALSEVIVDFPYLYSPVTKIFMSAIIIFIAYGKRRWRAFAVTLAWFYIMSLFAGGAVFGWLLFVNAGGEVPVRDISLLTVGWSHLLMGALIMAGLFLMALRRLGMNISQRQWMYRISVFYEGRQVSVLALLDTGNRLFSSSGQAPVILVEYKALKGLFNEEVRRYLFEREPERWLTDLVQCPDSAWLARIQCIPFRGVGRSSLLLGFRPDAVDVAVKASQVVRNDVAIIGIYSGNFDADGKYNALLHAEVLQRSNGEEEANTCA